MAYLICRSRGFQGRASKKSASRATKDQSRNVWLESPGLSGWKGRVLLYRKAFEFAGAHYIDCWFQNNNANCCFPDNYERLVGEQKTRLQKPLPKMQHRMAGQATLKKRLRAYDGVERRVFVREMPFFA